MSTIKDVARVAGVSFKTVSRFVNGETNIGPELCRRIEAAIVELNYRPTLAARQLAGKRTYVLTLIIPHHNASYVTRMMIAIAAHCRAAGYHLVTEIFGDRQDRMGAAAMPDLSVRSDAIIVIPPFADHQPLLEHLRKTGIPLVRVAAKAEGPDRIIRVDDTQISSELIRHLLSLGHRRIGMIGPPLPERAAETRVTGYRNALEQAGIAFDPELLVRGDFSFASGVAGATQLLALPRRPTAIFAASDEMALGVLARAQQLGYSVPKDFALAGFDGSPEGRMVSPPLTTVHQPIDDIARAAVEAAIGRGTPEPELRFALNLRGSTTGADELCLNPYEE